MGDTVSTLETIGDVASSGAQLYSTYSQTEALEEAADLAGDASAANLAYTDEQTEISDTALQERLSEAIAALSSGTASSVDALQPFAETGTQGYTTAQSNIMSGAETSAATDAISSAAATAPTGIRGISISDPVSAEISQQADLLGQSYQSSIDQSLLDTIGTVGQGSTTDIANIVTNASELSTSLGTETAAQRSAAMLGMLPTTISEIETSEEAKLLAEAAASSGDAELAEQIATLFGSYL